ncbi:MAG: CvpA family protein [Lachnospiraceae bacterium]|nr:CvpA family protein [Lachnospiraceae bacterium]
MNAATAIAFIIILAFIGEGYRKGLIMTIFAIIKSIIGAVIAAMICSSFAGVIPPHLSSIQPILFISIIGLVLGIIRVVMNLFNLVDKIPVAKQINRLAGLAAGLLHGIIIIWILLVFLTYVGDTEWGTAIIGIVKESDFLKFMNEMNPIRQFAGMSPIAIEMAMKN